MEPTTQNCKGKMSAAQIDECLKALSPIKFEDSVYQHKRMKLSEFVKNFFLLNNTHPTYYTANGKLNCDPGKRRSIVDVYRVCMHYYPKTTNIKTISKIFKKFREQHLLSTNLCGQVYRRVYRLVGISKGINTESLSDTTIKDEFGLTLNEFLELGED